MGYYDDLHKSVYDRVYRQNFARGSAWKMAKGAANRAVYDAQMRDVRSVESGSGRLSTVYKALMRGQTVTTHKPIEKRVDMTPGEALSAIYKAAGISTVGADGKKRGFLPGGTPRYDGKYKGGAAGGRFKQQDYDATTDTWLDASPDRPDRWYGAQTANVSELTPKERKKLFAVMQTIQAGGQVTSGGKKLDSKTVKLLLQNYGELPSDMKIPKGFTPELRMIDGKIQMALMPTGTKDDTAAYFRKVERAEVGKMAEKAGVPEGREYDVLMNYVQNEKGQYVPKATVKPFTRQVTFKGTKDVVVPMRLGEDARKHYEAQGVKVTYNISKGGERKSTTLSFPKSPVQVPGVMSPEAVKYYQNMGATVSDPMSQVTDAQIRAHEKQGTDNLPAYHYSQVKGKEERPVTLQDLENIVGKKEAPKIFEAQRAARKATDAKRTETKVDWGDKSVVFGGVNLSGTSVGENLSPEAKDYYSSLGVQVTSSGKTTSSIYFGGGKSVTIPGALSAEAQKFYKNLGVTTSVDSGSGGNPSTNLKGVRRTSRYGGGKTSIGSHHGHMQAKMLGQARAHVAEEERWMKEQESRQKEWDEYYKWVAEQEKLYEEQKKAEEKAEKQYQKDLAAYKKKKGQEEMADWASPTAYRKDRIQKPRRRPAQMIMQDAQAAVNWGNLANPFEAGTLGGMGRPMIRQEVRQRAREMGVTPREFRMNFFSPQIRQDIRQTVKAKTKGVGVRPQTRTTAFFSPAYILSGYGMQKGYGGKKQ